VPKPRFERMSERERAAILDVAARHFVDDGYERASANAIFDACGLSKSSAYLAFENKADLFGAVVLRAAERVLAAVPPFPRAVRGRQAYFDALFAWLSATVDAALADPTSARLLEQYALARKGGLVDAGDGRLDALAAASFDDVLSVGRAAGVVRDDLDPAILAALVGSVVSTLDLFHMERLATSSTRARGELLSVYVDTIARLVLPGGRRRSARPKTNRS